MAEKIKIAELGIDVSALIQSTQDVKKVIVELQNEQKKLTSTGETTSAKFIQNAADLKTLSSAYNSNLKAISESTTAQAEVANRSQLISLALGTEVVSIKEARDQNSLLNKLRNETNVTTAEGKKELDELNKKLDANNDFIKENADAYLKQKINIGNYSESIKDALGNLNPLNGGLSGFVQRSQEAGGAGNLVKTSLTGVTQGMMGLVRSSLAFIATPIGAVIAVLGVVLGGLYSLFGKLDPVVDAFEQGMAGLGGVFNKVIQVIRGFVLGLTDLGATFKKINGFITDPIGSLKSFSSELVKAGKAAADLKSKEQDLEDLKDVYNARNKAIEAEIALDKVRLKNKDLNGEQLKEIENRINENYKKVSANKLEVNDETLELTLKAAKETAVNLTAVDEARLKKSIELGDLEVAKKLKNAGIIQVDAYERIKEDINVVADSKNQQALDEERTLDRIEKARDKAQANAEKARAEQEDREQKAREKKQKNLDDEFEKSQLQLEKFLANQGTKAKSFEEELKIAEITLQKQLNINQKEFDASEKTSNDKLALEVANINARNAFIKTQSDAVVGLAKNELDNFILNNQSKIDANKYLSDEIVAEEKARNERILKEQKDFAELQLREGSINKETFDNQINALDLSNKEKNDELDLQRETAKKEKEAIDFENKLALSENEYLALTEKLERDRLAEVQIAESKGADVSLINEKYRRAKEQIDNAQRAKEISAISDSLGGLLGLLKENTLAYKAIAITKATIDTYQSAVAAYNAGLSVGGPVGLVLGPVSAGIAVASGLANIAKISGAKFEKGTLMEIEGKRHSQGGEPVFVGSQYVGEAEAGEGIGILRRERFSDFMNLNNGNLPTFANGGIISTAVSRPSLNIEELARVTTNAILNMPAPIVTVEDINYGQNTVAQIQQNVSF